MIWRTKGGNSSMFLNVLRASYLPLVCLLSAASSLYFGDTQSVFGQSQLMPTQQKPNIITVFTNGPNFGRPNYRITSCRTKNSARRCDL